MSINTKLFVYYFCLFICGCSEDCRHSSINEIGTVNKEGCRYYFISNSCVSPRIWQKCGNNVNEFYSVRFGEKVKDAKW